MPADPLIDDIAAIIDYAAFYSGSGSGAASKRQRRLARERAAEILAKIEKRGRLAPPPEAS